jgi:DNA repair photolyase
MPIMPNLIYEPKGRAREYAPLACNMYRGCDHACTYCYAPSATQRSRRDFVLSATRGPDFLASLTREAAKLQRTDQAGKQVLLSFTCDPYQHLDAALGVTRQVIQTLHRHGFSICTLTKGGTRALRDLDLFGPGDAFATSLTLLDPQASAAWEPGAALPADRIETIRRFHTAGITTWVSLEPVLDPAAGLEIIRQTHEFVDLYKVGKLNHHAHAQTINWQQWANDSTALLDRLGKRYYVKDDLAAFLSHPSHSLTLAELDTGQLRQPPRTLPQMSMF